MCRDVTLWDAIRITSCNIPNLQLVSPKILCCELQRKLKHLLIFGKLRDHAVQTFNNTNCLASFGEGTNYTMLNRRWNRPSDIQQIWHPASDIQQIWHHLTSNRSDILHLTSNRSASSDNQQIWHPPSDIQNITRS